MLRYIAFQASVLSAAVLLAVAVGTLAQAGSGAQGQNTMCRDREEGLAILSQQWGEELVGRGVSKRGQVLELAVNEVTGTWSLILTFPENPKVACLVEDGDGWEVLTPSGPGT